MSPFTEECDTRLNAASERNSLFPLQNAILTPLSTTQGILAFIDLLDAQRDACNTYLYVSNRSQTLEYHAEFTHHFLSSFVCVEVCAFVHTHDMRDDIKEGKKVLLLPRNVSIVNNAKQ